jgi:hypothetical protein
MFPASNAHACVVPATPLPAGEHEWNGTRSFRHPSGQLIVTELSGFSQVSFFGFLRRNINCEKRQGVLY